MVGVLPDHVFINCPFDGDYEGLFRAILFTILEFGYVPRCALETDDSSVNRLEKIMRIIEECQYGIHDVSAVSPGAANLPRFNMPLELGLFLGCKRFGGRSQRQKACLILDTEPYRYRASISDISGQDIHAHHGQPDVAIVAVRNWLAASSRKGLPGGAEMISRYRRFGADAPLICAEFKLAPDELTFSDRCIVIKRWMQANR